jgi:hypothetical protein
MRLEFDPTQPLLARIEIGAARAFDLQVGIQSGNGPASTLAHWLDDAGHGRPLVVTVPPLDFEDQLFVSLSLIGELDTGLLDVALALTQGGTLLPSSVFRFRERALRKLAELNVAYSPAGRGIELLQRDARVVSLDQGAWHTEPASGLLIRGGRGPLEQLDRSFNYGVHTDTTASLFKSGDILNMASWPLVPAGHSVSDDEGSSDDGGPPDPPPPAGSDDPADPPPPDGGEEPTERRINVWMAERENAPGAPLVRDESYTLCINVGPRVTASLVDDPAADIPDSDIPQGGLSTEWILEATGAELASLSSETTIDPGAAERALSWTARFAIRIPRSGESATIRLRCIPRAITDVRLRAAVYALDPERAGRAEFYRELTIDLWVVEPRMKQEIPSESSAAVRVVGDHVHAPAAQLNLRPTHEWTTPNGWLSLHVRGPGDVWVRGEPGSVVINHGTRWFAHDKVSQLFAPLRAAFDTFRGQHEKYLNLIPAVDLDARLSKHDPGADYFGKGDPSDASLDAWAKVVGSTELHALAAEGAALYNKFFPPESELREWMDELDRGGRLDITCQDTAGTAYIPHVPWGLMYRLPVPPAGSPIDPTGFLGLSLRLSYHAHLGKVASRALGSADKVYRAFFVYWGDKEQDPTAAEAKWQLGRWGALERSVLVPNATDTGGPKQRLVSLLSKPAPPPVPVLYLYCKCNTGPGNNPVLRFADDAKPENQLTRSDWALAPPLADRPLVFANACQTSSADPYFANELETGFFDRGARAFVGTESKVPVELASRFAAVFFHYFDREADPAPMAAGEAMYQARHFLWRNYLNIGGLFYTYVNEYDLYMADEEELLALRPR